MLIEGVSTLSKAIRNWKALKSLVMREQKIVS